MKDQRLYLEHIVERCDRIIEYTSAGHVAFLNSSQQQDAVIRNLEVVGEAAKQLSPETRDAMEDLDWRRIAGMRDVLIHNYMGVDLDEVWNVASREVPELRQAVTLHLTAI